MLFADKGVGVDDGRFESAWSAYGAAVLRYCAYSTGSSHTGEDVAAETFARFLARGDRVPAEHTEAWLIRVARNLCVTHHRAARRQDALAPRLGRESTGCADAWEQLDCWAPVRRLREPERLVLYLRIAEDRPFAEIARLTDRSESAVKMVFYRAIDRLRNDMHCGAQADTTLEGGAESVPSE